MPDLAPLQASIPAMSPGSISKVRELEAINGRLQQIPVRIDHSLHAGLYARTAYIPKGALVTGALVRVPTLLIANGDVAVYLGDDDQDATACAHLTGYNVIEAQAGRKQAFFASSATTLTMIFPTKARTIEEAEAEFTDEPEMLQTRRAECLA